MLDTVIVLKAVQIHVRLLSGPKNSILYFVFIDTYLYLIFHSGRRTLDSRLSSAQTALTMQEETIRRLERDRKAQNEKIEALEEGLGQAEDDRRQQKEKVMRLQQSEAKSEQEKEAMRVQIENAESRITKIELKKRSLEGTSFSNEFRYSLDFSV